MGIEVDIRLIEKLDEIAVEIRNILEIEEDRCIKLSDFDEIVNKITEKFPDYKIYRQYSMIFNLNAGKNVNIYYDQLASKYKIFEFVLQAFCYGILLNKEELTLNQLKNYTLFEQDIYQDKYAECLSKMVIIPNSLYMKEFTNFSRNDGAVNLKGISDKTGLEESDVIRRARQLTIWK